MQIKTNYYEEHLMLRTDSLETQDPGKDGKQE